MSVVPSEVRNNDLLGILIGGPYGGSYPLSSEKGHVAIHLITATDETVYDYGRYGNTWGTGGSEGEGILNLWGNFSDYIREENIVGTRSSGKITFLARTTTEFIYSISKDKSELIQSYYSKQIFDHVISPTKHPNVKRYKIRDYSGLFFNCTMISLNAIESAYPGFKNVPAKYIQGEGLIWYESALIKKTMGWPEYIFMPSDLKNYLESNEGIIHLKELGLEQIAVNIYHAP